MRGEVEKPLLKIGNKTMLERVLSAVKQSKHVEDVVVAVSANAPHTAAVAQSLHERIIETPGVGYGEDMQYVVKNLRLGNVLIVSADLPFLTTAIVDKAIEAFRHSAKPALSVMTPLAACEEIGVKPEYFFEVSNRKLVPIGLNLIDGTRIDEPELDQLVLEVSSKDLALNVNSPSEYELAKQFEKEKQQ